MRLLRGLRGLFGILRGVLRRIFSRCLRRLLDFLARLGGLFRRLLLAEPLLVSCDARQFVRAALLKLPRHLRLHLRDVELAVRFLRGLLRDVAQRPLHLRRSSSSSCSSAASATCGFSSACCISSARSLASW